MRAARIFRVFISSTFSDFERERETLRRSVHPRLEELCEARGARFEAVDLRWGVSPAAGRRHETLDLCLRELDRCRRLSPRPSFLVLLGDRYGWRPVPASIEAVEFDVVMSHVPRGETRDFVSSWFRRDDNARPPVFRLRPHDLEDDAWAGVERRLRTTLAEAAVAAGLPGDVRQKYSWSATHAEVQHGMFAAGAAQAIAVVRTIRNKADHLDDARLADYVDIAGGEFDREAASALEALKAEVAGRLGGDVLRYDIDWRGSAGGGISSAHLEALAEDVFSALRAAILDELGKADPSPTESASHAAFAVARTTVFRGRDAEIATILSHLDRASDDTAPAKVPLLVTGRPGSGKSALMAMAAARAKETRPGILVVSRFIGADAASRRIAPLLSDIAREVGLALGLGVGEPDAWTDPATAVGAFRKTLEAAGAQRPVALFVDALDQAAELGRLLPLDWLEVATCGVSVVVSTGSEAIAMSVRRSYPGLPSLDLGPLDAAAVASLLDAWLENCERTLTPEQRRAVLESRGGDVVPLDLRLVIEVVRHWASFDGVVEDLAPSAAGLVRQFVARLSRANEHGATLVSRALAYVRASRHGVADKEMLDLLSRDPRVREALVARSVGRHREYLTAMKVDEGIPPIVWSRLYFDLEPFLAQMTADGVPLIGFFHRVFESVLDEDLERSGDLQDARRRMVDYFDGQPTYDGKERDRPNRRKLAELPYLCARGGEWTIYSRVLCDYGFIDAKVATGGLDDLVLDFGLGEGLVDDTGLATWRDFILRNRHLLRRGDASWPAQRILFQLAIEYGRDTAVTRGAEEWLAAGRVDGVRLHSICRGTSPSVPRNLVIEDRRLEGVLQHSSGEIITRSRSSGVTVWDSVSGARRLSLRLGSAGVDGMRMLDADLLLAWSHRDGSATFDLRSGRHVWRRPDLGVDSEFGLPPIDGASALVARRRDGRLVVLDGRTGRERCALDDAGARWKGCVPCAEGVISAWDDAGRVVLFDGSSGRRIAVLSGHSGDVDVHSVAGGERLLTTSGGTTRLWSTVDGALVARLAPRTGNCAFPIADGSIATFDGRVTAALKDDDVGGRDEARRVRIWNARTGNLISVLEGHATAVRWLRDAGRGLVATTAHDLLIRVWDPRSGTCVHELEAARDTLFNPGLMRVEALQDGRIVTLYTAIVEVWDVMAGERIALLEHDHGLAATKAVALRNGRLATICWRLPFGKELRVWDMRSPSPALVARVSSGVEDVVELTDGRLAVRFADRLLVGEAAGLEETSTSSGHTALLRLPSGALLAWGGRTVERIDVETGERVRILDTAAESIGHLEIDGDGRVIAYGKAQRFWTWNADTGDEPLQIALPYRRGLLARWLRGRVDVGDVCAVRRLDGRRLVAMSDTLAAVCDLASGHVLRVFRGLGRILNVVLRPGREPLAIRAGLGGGLRLHMLDSGRTRTLYGHEGVVEGVLPLPGDRLLSFAPDRTIRIWDLASRMPVARLDTFASAETGDLKVEVFGDWIVARLAGEPDRPVDGRILSWRIDDVATGREPFVFDGHAAVRHFDIAPVGDGRFASAVGGELLIWDVASGRRLHAFRVDADLSVTRVQAVGPDALLVEALDCATLSPVLAWVDLAGKRCRILRGATGVIPIDDRRLLITDDRGRFRPVDRVRGRLGPWGERRGALGDLPGSFPAVSAHGPVVWLDLGVGGDVLWHSDEDVVQATWHRDSDCIGVVTRSGDVHVVRLHAGGRHITADAAARAISERGGLGGIPGASGSRVGGT